ncbi:MAG TPA: tetratricopeptide repeat protein, partial [Xanthomonadales bacterium]|nr:tetratricopeptide repeat protein [Xanthomonadales bacterium]
LVGGWLAVQIAATLLPVFEAPPWVMRVLVGLLAIGFVAAVLFAWLYELTPAGLKREREIPEGASITAHTGRRMDRLIVAGLVLAVAVVAADRMWPGADSMQSPSSAGAAPTPADPAEPTTEKLTIAVLPFVNLSADAEQEYFSDGITEEILNGLARVDAFTVTSRTSSFHFKDKDQPLPEIAKALGVDYVLEGSVRKAGAQVRITAQLIRVAGDAHLWSDSWTRDLADVFAVQEDIARQVARELQARLTPGDEARLGHGGTRDPHAYEAFLRGRHLLAERTIESLESAVVAFRAALDADPAFVEAWAGLAQAWALLPEYTANSTTPGRQVRDTYADAKDAADRALELDPASSAALTARAYVRVMHDFDWERAEADYRAAIAADPRNAVARQWYGEMLAYQRRWDESHEQYDSARASDPLSPILHTSHGMALTLQGEYAAAIPRFEESLRIAPGFSAGRPVEMFALAELGQFERAAELLAASPADLRAYYGPYIAAKRDASATGAAVDAILAHGAESLVGKPLLLASLGRRDLALDALERLFAHEDPYRVFLYCMAMYEPLHADPRFAALLRQIGLPRAAPART